MRRPSRRTIVVASISAATVAVLVAGTIITVTLKADADAQSAYDDAAATFASATNDLNGAKRGFVIAQQKAVFTARNAKVLSTVDSTLLADTVSLGALNGSVAALVTAAGLVDADGAVAAPSALSRFAPEPRPEPADRTGLRAAAADLRAESTRLAAETAALTIDQTAIATASDDVDAAAAAVAAAAYAFGSATTAPARASTESVAAFTAAVAALEAPAADGDVAALVLAYQAAWYAAVASDAAARAGSGADAATYIHGILIVNKTYGLPSSFGNGLTTETSDAFAAMKADAAALGLDLYISSGFRSFSAQTSVYNRYKANEGQDGADRHSARPGHSEHQSGLAFDLNSITTAFGSTPEGIWVRDNAHLYGFIVRYPPDKESITGYVWEPWHLRYVGTAVAAELYASGQTLEEYLGVTSVYS